MAEPLGRRLRAARRSGLTSPEPVRTPTAPAATPNPVPEPGTQDKPHSRRAAGRPRPESPRETPRAGIKPETSYRNWPVDRGLAAEWMTFMLCGYAQNTLHRYCRLEHKSPEVLSLILQFATSLDRLSVLSDSPSDVVSATDKSVDT